MTATRLFPANGIRAVGIDRILKEAGVAKASLYNTYGSKDELVVAYLRAVAERDRALWATRAERLPGPRDRILALFDIVREQVEPATPGSCHLAAAVEFPSPATEGERAIRAAVADHRNWVVETIRTGLWELGLRDEENISDLMDRLAVLHDGAVTTSMLGGGHSSVTARDMAATILDMISDPD